MLSKLFIAIQQTSFLLEKILKWKNFVGHTVFYLVIRFEKFLREADYKYVQNTTNQASIALLV